MTAIAALLFLLPLQHQGDGNGEPNISGRCQFGVIEQANRNITIRGAWSGTGTIRNRWVKVVWKDPSGRMALGAYLLNADGDLEGHYGFIEAGVQWDECDGVMGPVTGEVIKIVR